MSWKEDLFTYATNPALVNPRGVGRQNFFAVCANKLFPEQAPDGQTAPYTVYSEVNCNDETTHSGPSHVEHNLVQFTSWAKTQAEADAIRQVLRDILEGNAPVGTSRFVATFSNKLVNYDPVTKLRGSILELRIHADY